MSHASKQAESRRHEERRAAAREILEEALADTADLRERMHRVLATPHEAVFLFGNMLGIAVRWQERIRAYHAKYIERP